MSKVYIVNGNAQYHRMFREMDWEITTVIKDADLVQFTGGEDVSPHLYGEDPHPQTYSNFDRDQYELSVYRYCLENGIKMAGICRGGQFLNVASGGAMWQHVDGHAIYGTHKCIDIPTGTEHQVTSTHHQMMRPSDKGILVGGASESSFYERMSDNGVVFEQVKTGYDVEVVYYPHTDCLCFQPHPEFPGADSTREYYFELVKRYHGLE